jgi:hypothetical protein
MMDGRKPGYHVRNVALLVYRPYAPRRAGYFPFCIFSPEWQALQYAAEHDIPARFIDLPQGILLASDAAELDTTPKAVPLLDAPAGEEPGEAYAVRQDPFALLARAAGYEDRELWWESQVERHRDATDLFGAILELMVALRAEAEAPDAVEARCEAWMR